MLSLIKILIFLLFLNIHKCLGFVPIKGRIVNRLSIKMQDSTGRAKTDSILAFKGLRSNMFAHPLDVRVTKFLSQVPLVQSLTRGLFSTVEQALVVENLGSSILVGPNQMPQLYRSLQKASKILDIEAPDLYVKQNPIPNAYTLAYQGKKPFIVVHTSLLDLLNEEEVLAVLGHELGHLKCEHGVWITLLNLLVESVTYLVGPLRPLKTLLLTWQRSAEFTCDRASLLVTQDHKVVASVMMKLCGGSMKNNFSKELNVDAFLEQAKTLENESNTVIGKLLMQANDQIATHPIPLVRATELLNFYKSEQFMGLKKRGRKIELS